MESKHKPLDIKKSHRDCDTCNKTYDKGYADGYREAIKTIGNGYDPYRDYNTIPNYPDYCYNCALVECPNAIPYEHCSTYCYDSNESNCYAYRNAN